MKKVTTMRVCPGRRQEKHRPMFACIGETDSHGRPLVSAGIRGHQIQDGAA
jgi:hypothetical protein